MEVSAIPGSNRNLSPPDGWDQVLDGPCVGLPVRDGLFYGAAAMASWWRPSADELKRLQMGFPVQLIVCGTAHPPVCLLVPDVIPAEFLKVP